MANTYTPRFNIINILKLALAITGTKAFIPYTTSKINQRVPPVNIGMPTKTDYLSSLPPEIGLKTSTVETQKITPATQEIEAPILVQGGSLRTWSYRSPLVEQVQVVLSSEGRPLDADLELWHGPDNTPCKLRVYVEDGHIRPFNAVIATPRGPNTIAIRNIGQIEFPLSVQVDAETPDTPSNECTSSARTIQGGALRTYPFDPLVNSVQILLKTDGRPLNARIELLQGPNNNKQVVELYTEDGFTRPFFCILETPDTGNVVRVVNTAPVEFPMTAAVVPHTIDQEMSSYKAIGGTAILGGDLAF
tara:strand:+ start:3852 stop:4766 length:915 start_codon:yes stop_codon:yes gene_type:complete